MGRVRHALAMLRAYAAHRKGRSALRSEGALQEEAAGELSLGSLAPSDDGDEGGLEANHEDDDDSLGSLAPSDEEDANEPSGIPAATSMQAAFDGLCLGGLREQWTHEQHTHTQRVTEAAQSQMRILRDLFAHHSRGAEALDFHAFAALFTEGFAYSVCAQPYSSEVCLTARMHACMHNVLRHTTMVMRDGGACAAGAAAAKCTGDGPAHTGSSHAQ